MGERLKKSPPEGLRWAKEEGGVVGGKEKGNIREMRRGKRQSPTKKVAGYSEAGVEEAQLTITLVTT